MNHNSILALVILIALAALFTLVIFFGLQIRKRNFAKSMELKALDIWPQIQDAGFDFSCLLYGVWQDFSATRLGMIVRDCRDQHVGKISYRTGVGQGWISIETADGNFEADVLPTLRQSVSLRPASEESQSLCDFTRLAGGAYRFDAKSLGILESKPPGGLHMAPLFEYTLNGTPVGASRHVGGSLDRGRMLLLPTQIPLPIRLFVLAMQGERS